MYLKTDLDSIFKIANDILVNMLQTKYDGDLRYLYGYPLTLLTCKYLIDNSQNSSYKIPSGFKWESLTKNSSTREIVNKTLLEFENINPSIEGVFTEFKFKNLPESLVYKIVHQISLIDLRNKEFKRKIPEIIARLVYWYAPLESTTEKKPGELADLMTGLLEPINISVYLPSNTWDVLPKVLSFREPNDLLVSGHELDKRKWALSKMYLIISGLLDFNVLNNNALINPILSEDRKLKQFDYAILNTVFHGNWKRDIAKNDQFGRFKYGTPSASYGDMALLLHTIASLSERGRLCAVVTRGLLGRSGADQEIRHYLVSEDLVEGVISLPGNIYQYANNIPMYLLMINKRKDISRKGKVIFINFEDFLDRRKEGINPVTINEISCFYRELNYIKPYSKDVSLDDMLPKEMIRYTIDDYSRDVSSDEIQKSNNCNLVPEIYFETNNVHTEIGQFSIDIKGSTFKKVSIKEVSENIFRGMQPLKDIEKKKYECGLVNLSDITNGEINLSTVSQISFNDYREVSKFEIFKDDLIISGRGLTKIAVVPEIKSRLVISRNLICIRLKEMYDPYFLKFILESPIGTYYIKRSSASSSQLSLSPKQLEEFSVPNISITDQIEEYVSRAHYANDYMKAKIKKLQEQRNLEFLKIYKELGLSTEIRTDTPN